jgi:hypothetical protein
MQGHFRTIQKQVRISRINESMYLMNIRFEVHFLGYALGFSEFLVKAMFPDHVDQLCERKRVSFR